MSTTTEQYNDLGRITGGIFIALSKALSTEAARAATDVLYRFSNNPSVREEDRRIFRAIANAASRSIEELAAENDHLDLLAAGPNLRVVGGNSVTIST